jgi:hypothetical protein
MKQGKPFPWLVNDVRTITTKTNKQFIYIESINNKINKINCLPKIKDHLDS